jgi:hypothetical protein
MGDAMRACALLLVGLLIAARADVGVCTGADPCRVCKDCSQCLHCSPKNPRGGSCGVLRAQNAEAAKKRMKKQDRAAGR